MKEARLILPNLPSTHHASNRLRNDLIAEFGGVTMTHGYGAWTSPAGHVEAEPVTVFDVAVDELVRGEHDLTLRQLAERARINASQQAVYLRLPSGEVEFVTAQAQAAAA